MLTQHSPQINRSDEEGWPIIMNAGSLIFAGDLLMLPAGLLIAGLLTRGLGPDGYGSFAIAASLVVGIEWALAAALSRSTIHGVSQAEGWRPVARTLLNWHLALGIAVLLLLWMVAWPLASLFDEPQFVSYFALLACDVPFFMVGQAYRNILIGRGSFVLRALTGASRWVSRLVFTVIAFQSGISIIAAIATCIGASIVESTVGRLSLGSLKSNGTAHRAGLKRLAATLMVSSLSLAILSKMDLLIIKMLGWPAQQAGFYAAAQNLALLPGIFGQAISGVLLSVLTRLAVQKDWRTFRQMAQKSLHAGLCLLPIAGVVAGGATELATICFGQAFQSAAYFLPILFLGAVAQVVFGLFMAVLTAGGHATSTALLAGPLVLIALGGHLWSIPHWGPVGAAWTTTITMVAGAFSAFIAARRLLSVQLGYTGLILGSALGMIGWGTIMHTPSDPLWRLPEMVLCSILLTGVYAWHQSLIGPDIVSAWRQAWQRKLPV